MRPFGVFCLVMSFLGGVVLMVVGFTQDPWVVWEIIGGAIMAFAMATIGTLLMIDKNKADRL